MIKRLVLKAKSADNNFFIALLKIIYFNVFKKNRFVIYEFDLTTDFTSPSLNPGEYDVKVIDFRQLREYLPERKDLPREFMMHEIDGVENCVVILNENKVAHISWIYMKGDRDRWFDLGGDEAHVNYSFTFPEFRGKALFPQALLATAEWLRARNFRRILMDVHEGTTFMIKSQEKLANSKKIGILAHWCFYRPKFRR